MIVAYLDPDRLRSYNLSTDEVASAVARANLTLPAGNVRVGDFTTIAATNAMVADPKELETLPVRGGPGPAVLLKDVGRIEDSADVVSNVALVNGRHTVYMPVTKLPDASTLDVVSNLKAALPGMRAAVPDDVHVDFEFDQSVFVKNAIRGLVSEGVLGAILTALTVLLFLRSFRSALIVIITIPLSLLSALIALRLVGQTVNIMTLGGLALAVGVLVDEATVAIENIHTHLASGAPARRAVFDAMGEVMQPRFLAMLCILAVFIPTFFLVGVGRALFPPLALAVGFSMVASYLLSSSLVPVLATWLFERKRGQAHDPAAEPAAPGRVVGAYHRLSESFIRHRWFVFGAYLLAAGAILFLFVPRLGTELFPAVDTGQFQVRVRAPPGTRLERTEEIVRGVEDTIREEVGPGGVRMTLANIGNPAWTYPVNAVYTFNAGPQEAVLLTALAVRKRPLPELEETLRRELGDRYPDVLFSFEAGDIVSQVLNFGARAPIDVAVSGKSLADVRKVAERIESGLRGLPELRDVQIPLALDFPTLDVSIDRERGGQLGVSVDRVGKSIVSATSSSVLTTPIFWTDPKSGVGYRLQVRVPENRIQSAEDLANLPVMQDGSAGALLRDVATVRAGTTPGEIDHYNSQRTISVNANVVGGDLGRAASDVQRVIRSIRDLPKGMKIALHGQAEQMRTSLESLEQGLGLSAVVILLLLTANFQSVRAAAVVLLTVPAVLAGVVLGLSATRTTLNVQSLMGAIMSIGVSVANALLIVTFARERWRQGDTQQAAALGAAQSRLRPVLMTSVAMIVGMLPTALAFGEGAEQSAPLGRAVIGGLVASTFATLLFLPALYVVIAPRGAYRTVSLHPDEAAQEEPS
jgi:multidrug efflux pump subunit AcrB